LALAAGLLAAPLDGVRAADGADGAHTEPPDVAGLAWREACNLSHAHVRPPLWAAPKLRAAGLPTVARGTAWSAGQLVRLGWLYSGGTLTGSPDYGEARRLYCLALRRDGHVPAAVLLGELHAEGWGVPRSPGLAAHFARVGALGWHGEPELLSYRVAQFDLEQLDPAGQARQQAAAAWLAAPGPRAGDGFADLARQYRDGDGVPRSHLLADYLLYRASESDSRFVIPYVRHFVDAHRGWIVEDEALKLRLLLKALAILTDRSVPEGRAFFGSLFFEGVLVEQSFVAAAMWICEGYVFGAETGRAWCDWLNTRTPAQRRMGTAHVDSGNLPKMRWNRPK
jgi:TPR repeat protein